MLRQISNKTFPTIFGIVFSLNECYFYLPNCVLYLDLSDYLMSVIVNPNKMSIIVKITYKWVFIFIRVIRVVLVFIIIIFPIFTKSIILLYSIKVVLESGKVHTRLFIYYFYV